MSKPKTAPRPKKPRSGAFWSGGELSRQTGIPHKTLSAWTTEGKIPRAGVGMWDPIPSLTALVTLLLKRHEEDDASARAARRQTATSEAAMADMARAKMERTLVSRDDYKNNYADAIASGVRNISRLKISDATKEMVFAALRAVKLADIETE